MRVSILDKWGKMPLCNEKPERALRIGNFCFPLCWRCTMIITGLAAGWCVSRFIYPGIFLGLLSSLLVLPCLIDGMHQYLTDYVSTNGKRIIFGFPAGFGMFLSAFSFLKLLLGFNK